MIITASATEPTSHEPITDAIVSSVAEAEDVDPLELPPLWEVIDPEALEELFAPGKTGRPRTGRVAFDYYGYEISVSCGESITVSVEK